MQRQSTVLSGLWHQLADQQSHLVGAESSHQCIGATLCLMKYCPKLTFSDSRATRHQHLVAERGGVSELGSQWLFCVVATPVVDPNCTRHDDARTWPPLYKPPVFTGPEPSAEMENAKICKPPKVSERLLLITEANISVNRMVNELLTLGCLNKIMAVVTVAP